MLSSSRHKKKTFLTTYHKNNKNKSLKLSTPIHNINRHTTPLQITSLGEKKNKSQ